MSKTKQKTRNTQTGLIGVENISLLTFVQHPDIHDHVGEPKRNYKLVGQVPSIHNIVFDASCMYMYIYIYMHSYIDIYQISSLIGVTCTPSFVRDLSSLLVSARTPHVSLDLVYARTPSLVRDLSSNLLYARTPNISPDLVYARTPSFVRGLSSLLEYARTPKHDTTQHIILECFSLFLFSNMRRGFTFWLSPHRFGIKDVRGQVIAISIEPGKSSKICWIRKTG